MCSYFRSRVLGCFILSLGAIAVIGCDNGTASKNCTNECVAGSSTCDGTALYHCGDYNGDSCTEWGDLQACPGACSIDHCEGTCSDACGANETGCTDELTRWTCTDVDADGCLDRLDESCGAGEHCENGACVDSWTTIDLGIAASYFDVAKDALGGIHIIWAQGSDLSYAQTDGLDLTEVTTLSTTAHTGLLMPPGISVFGQDIAVVYGTGAPVSCSLCIENVLVAIRNGQEPWIHETVFAVVPDCDLYTYPSLGLAGDGGLHVFAACVKGASTTYMDYRYRSPDGTWDSDVKQGPYGVDFMSRMMTDQTGRVHLLRSIWCNPSFYQIAEVGDRFDDAAAEDEVDICLGGMAENGSVVHSVWIEFPTGGGDPCTYSTARLMHATDGGLGFETQADIAEMAHCGDFNLPSMAMLDRGDLIVAWAESDADDGTAERIRVAAKIDGDTEWSSTEIASNGGVYQSATVKVVAVGDRPFVFWLNDTGTISVSSYP